MNRTAPGSAHTAVGDQRGAAQARGNEETPEAAGCAADRAAVVDNRGIARGRGIEEVGNTFHVKSAAVHHIGAVIDNRGTASGRGVEEDRSAALSAGGYGSGVGDDCATSRGRAV